MDWNAYNFRLTVKQSMGQSLHANNRVSALIHFSFVCPQLGRAVYSLGLECFAKFV